MVFVLGVHLPDRKLAKIALTSFYGVSHHTAERLCARLHIHKTQRTKDLTPQQVTSLAAFLSSPSTAPPLPRLPLADPDFVPPEKTPQINLSKLTPNKKDPLLKLKIESELKRDVRENIAHQRMIGSYVGRRHAMSLPVRGQNTQTNAKNAKKFNRIERFL